MYAAEFAGIVKTQLPAVIEAENDVLMFVPGRTRCKQMKTTGHS